MLINASIDLMKIDTAKVISGKKGGKYVNLTIWTSDEADKFGNDVSIQQTTATGEKKIYIGNGRVYKKNDKPNGDLPY